ncbi:MAG: aminotransferase class V-fold PLP-dependent enzyme [Thiogranum sp.]|nr:aminotransferase class V-fold PLP-dependent enzyme [Thiogranum sp.]
MTRDSAECGRLPDLLQRLGEHLDRYQRFEHDDAMRQYPQWQPALERPVPQQGVGIEQLLHELGHVLIPNASAIPNPGCTAFITTGATTAGALASLAGAVAAPQRIGLTAFNYLEELSLQWLADMFELPAHMKGVYSSGGSVANLVALGAARQWAFEQRGADPAQDGVDRPCRIYATEASHRTIHRAAAVLGLGRNAVVTIAADALGRMRPEALRQQLEQDAGLEAVPVAVVANAGTTSTGAIDPLREIGEIARAFSLWFHVDGAYGLPGILDPQVRPLYDGLALADSVIVDPHKWLGAPVGIGATFVRDRSILNRAFTQGASDYLEGSFSTADAQHSMDSPGIPYSDFGVELSAPSRGAVVWALIREIGIDGLHKRVCRHNAMARHLAKRAQAHPQLEVVQEPTLSICCFRFVAQEIDDLNEFNRRLHRRLVQAGRNIPSTAVINGVFSIRPCFVGARTGWEQADALVDEVIETGQRLLAEQSSLQKAQG